VVAAAVLLSATARGAIIAFDEPTQGSTIWTAIITGLSGATPCANGIFQLPGTADTLTATYCTDSAAAATANLFAVLVEPDGTTLSDVVEVSTIAGSINVTVSICSVPGPCQFPPPGTFSTVIETGGFQDMITYVKQDGTTDTVQLRSSLPEAPTLALLAVCFIVIGVGLRRNLI